MGLEIPEVGFLQDLHGLRKEVIVEEIAEPAIHVGLGCADPGHADLAGECLAEGRTVKAVRASTDEAGALQVPKGVCREFGSAVVGRARGRSVHCAGLEPTAGRTVDIR